jgi:hypothetical protein
MIKQLFVFAALASSTSSFAGWVKHGKLNVNEDSIQFVGNGCTADDSFVSFNGDGSFDLVFTNLQAEALGKRVNTVCQFKFEAKIPAGLTFTSSKVGVAGISDIKSEDGSTIATLRHTLGGKVGEAAIASYKFDSAGDVKDVLLEKQLDFAKLVWNPCGKDVTFKTTATLNASGENAFINLSEGAQKGRTYSVRYYLTWKKC